MNYQNILVLMIVLIICLSFKELNQSLLAVSPSVPFSLAVKNPFLVQSDFLSADYYSDGKALNATIWLRSHLGQTGLRFGMIISIGGIVKPITFYDMYLRNEHNGSSTRHITQIIRISPPNAINLQYGNRSLDAIDAFTGSYDKANRFVDLSLNLARIGSPIHYFINFYLANGTRTLARTFTDGVPNYSCTLSCLVVKTPTSVTVTAGGRPVTVPIIIEPGNSTAFLQDSARYFNETYILSFHSNPNLTGIRYESTPVTVPIIPGQQKVSRIIILVSNGAPSGNYSLPLDATLYANATRFFGPRNFAVIQ
jgi:hypothetical protein